VLTHEENELLVRVGPGSPMGDYMREFWMPALRSESLEADGAPRRVRLLGENFVAFRATDGRVGFFDEGCPHRCTSLALARNEDNALTCIFHGWKIDVSGKVVEVPSEPPERRAEFAAKVRVRHYPVREAGAMVWVYLGKDEQPPRFLDFELNTIARENVEPFPALVHSNWLQGLETTIDSSHLGVLHAYWLKKMSTTSGSAMASMNNGPTYEYLAKPYGFREAALRDLFDGTVYQRIREVMLPFFSFVPMDHFMPHLTIIVVPVDDEWHWQWYIWFFPDKPLSEEQHLRMMGGTGTRDNVAADFRHRDENWGQDRKAMKEGHWSGFQTLNYEDFAVGEAPGVIMDRSREYLGSSDSTLIRLRRMLLAAVRAHRQGLPVYHRDPSVDFGKVRAVTLRAQKDLDWKEVDPFNPPPSLPFLG